MTGRVAAALDFRGAHADPLSIAFAVAAFASANLMIVIGHGPFVALRHR
jgi:hypothetical protein